MMEDYGILAWIVIGGIAGGIAKLLMPGKDPGGCIVTILLGVAGALVAGWLGRLVGWYDAGDQGAGFIAAIVGAFLILLIYRVVAGRRRV
ncbi:GlsB/YeaQ/YmgE family stress response membrane protein [Sphingomonas lutea]|nr:GlsB/YeaQ/YmgE family stress response membrane protein [Sphingomonas lutea]